MIQRSIPLNNKNWFQTGGPADYYAAPINAHEFAEAIKYAHNHKLPIFLLGEGANVLISDEGFKGLVIHPQLTQMEQIDTKDVRAGAGVSMNQLIEWCLDHQLLGLEEFSGIPGTVGGSVYINLHYFQFLLEQFLVSATVIERATGKILSVDRTWFQFGYNSSRLHDEEHYLVDATFALKSATDLEIAYARGRRTEIIRHRKARYPIAHTCGSFFRNFYEQEVTIESNGKKAIWVAYYLDKVGVKGALRIGGAAVSYQHANMIINENVATTSDIIAVARSMQKKVYQEFGIIPQPECRLIGFDTYPLHSSDSSNLPSFNS